MPPWRSTLRTVTSRLRAADGIANLAFDIGDFAALIQDVRVEEVAGQQERDSPLFHDVVRRMAEDVVGVRRGIRKASGIVGNQDDVSNDAHDVAMQRLRLLQRLGRGTVLGDMIEPVFKLSNLSSQSLVFFNKFSVCWTALGHCK